MKSKLTRTQTRLCLTAAFTLLIGLGSAFFIYRTAGDIAKDSSIDQFENSKIYTHNLELVGGKVSVLTDEFFRWFDGLWHGKALACTLFYITVFLTAVLLLAVYYSAPEPDPAERSERNQD